MSAVRRFEDLVAWQKAHQLAGLIYEATTCGAISGKFALKDQMRRAAVSIVSNVAEGYERHGRRDFARCEEVSRTLAGLRRALEAPRKPPP